MGGRSEELAGEGTVDGGQGVLPRDIVQNPVDGVKAQNPVYNQVQVGLCVIRHGDILCGESIEAEKGKRSRVFSFFQLK